MASVSAERDMLHIESSEARVAAEEASSACAKHERDAADLRKQLRDSVGSAGKAASPPSRSPTTSGSSWHQDIVAGVREARDHAAADESHFGDAGGDDFDRDIARLARERSAAARASQDASKAEVEQLREAMKAVQKQAAAKDASLTRLSRELEQRKVDERKIESVNYAKNVVVQFVSAPSDEVRVRMLPALSAVLEFDSSDKAAVQKAFPRMTSL